MCKETKEKMAEAVEKADKLDDGMQAAITAYAQGLVAGVSIVNAQKAGEKAGEKDV